MSIYDVSRHNVGLLDTAFELIAVTTGEVDMTERPEFTVERPVVLEVEKKAPITKIVVIDPRSDGTAEKYREKGVKVIELTPL